MFRTTFRVSANAHRLLYPRKNTLLSIPTQYSGRLLGELRNLGQNYSTSLGTKMDPLKFGDGPLVWIDLEVSNETFCCIPQQKIINSATIDDGS